MNQAIVKKKHILHLPKWYPHPADIQNGVFIKKHIEATTEKFDASVVFVTSAKQEKCFHIETHVEQDVFTVMAFFKEYEHQNIFKSSIHAFRYFIALCRGIRLTKKQFGKLHLIHAHILLRTAIIAWFYAFYYQIPFIISEHWSGFMNGNFQKKNFLYRKLVFFTVKRAARITVVSEILKESLVKLGIGASKISVVPNIVDSLPKGISWRKKPVSNKVIFVSVADLIDQIKNISDIIKSVAEISKNQNFEYWIIGDGEDKETLVNLAKSLGVMDKQVFFLGRKSNVEVLEILNEIDFLVMNSNTETFSVVTAEALLAGKPVIATRCGGPEVFVNEKNGILIEPGNRVALKSSLVKMIENYQNYNPEVLKSTISEKYSRDVIGKKIIAIYDDLIG